MPVLRAQPNDVTKKPVTVRAIHASAGVHAWYFAELDRAIAEMQRQVSTAVLAAYSTIEPAEMAHDSTALATDAPRNPSLLLRTALRKWGGLWVSKFDKLSLDLGKRFASKSFGQTQTQMKAALKDAGFTVKFEPTPASVGAFHATVAEQVNLIKSIPQQYLKDVETKVWDSVMKGGDMHTLSVDIRKTYGVTRDRAATIARDQNNKAKATIERTRRQELGITHAIWQHSAGGKVPRATHVAMTGKPYLISEGMYDSAVGRYVWPGTEINCRCTSRAVITAFETIEQAAAKSPQNTKFMNAARSRSK